MNRKEKYRVVKLYDRYLVEETGVNGRTHFVNDGYKNREWKTLKGALNWLKNNCKEESSNNCDECPANPCQ